MDSNKIREHIRNELVKCKVDPVYFMKTYCKIQHPKKGTVSFNLYPFQEQVLRDLKQHNYNVILKARQMGISTLTAGYIAWLMVFHNDKNCLVIATRQDVAKNLVTKIRVMYQKLPSWFKSVYKGVDEDNKLSLRFKNGSQVKAVSSSEESARSEALSLLVIDEAAFVKQIDGIWTSAQQTLATGGQAVVLSTPNGQGNFFADTWEDAETNPNSRWNPIKLEWHLHPERDQVWADEQLALLGERRFAQEIGCDFISSGHTVVDGSILKAYKDFVTANFPNPIESRGYDKNYHIWEYPVPNGSYLVTADVARGDGSDFSAFHVFRVDDPSGKMVQVAEYEGKLDTKTYAHTLVNVATEYNDALLVVDNASIGWSVVQEVEERGYRNLYYSQKNDARITAESYLSKQSDLGNSKTMTPGFTISHTSRPLLISKMEIYLREFLLELRSHRLVNQLFVFVYDDSGRPQASKGKNDDLVISFALACWMQDTALKYRNQGMELNRLALNKFGKVKKIQYNSYGTPNNRDPWAMQYGNQELDLRWLNNSKPKK